MADVINEMSPKPAPAFLLGLIKGCCTALPGRPPPTVPPHWRLSIVLLTILDLLNALYSVCQRRNDSERDWVITNSGGTTHTRLSCFSYPFSWFNKICHTNTKSSFIVSLLL